MTHFRIAANDTLEGERTREDKVGMVEAARRRPKPREELGAPNSAIYSSKIIKAGALLADTKTLLAHWDTSVPAQMNLDRLRRENVFGKASRRIGGGRRRKEADRRIGQTFGARV
jgi:hypothetical protein